MIDASQVGGYVLHRLVGAEPAFVFGMDVVTWQKKAVWKQMSLGFGWHSESSVPFLFNPGTLHYKSASRDRNTHKTRETNKKFCGKPVVVSAVIWWGDEVKLQTTRDFGSIFWRKISACLGWLVDRQTDRQIVLMTEWLINWWTETVTSCSGYYVEKVKFAYPVTKLLAFCGSQNHVFGSYFDPDESTLHQHDLVY